MINSLGKDDDFITKKMIDLLIKNGQWKDVKSEKIKVFPLVCSKCLSSWTGLGRSGHVQITTFGPISHVLGPKLSFLRNF